MPLDSEAPIGFWDLIDELEGEVTRAGVESLSVHLDAVPQEVQANYADYLEEILGELYELRVTGFFGVPYVGDSLNAALMTIIVRGEEHVQQTLNSDRRVRAKGDMGAALDLYERLAAAATQPSSPAGPLRARFIDPYLFPRSSLITSKVLKAALRRWINHCHCALLLPIIVRSKLFPSW
nr:hypothetical protein GCM10025730_05840 [Promicromonospora thailandica]